MKTQRIKILDIIKHDLPSSIVVFLVALPLCLGIALASGAPLLSGIIAGIIGGLVVSMVSGSHVSVSGPAAGLTVIVISAINQIGTFDGFLMAVVYAGILQLILGFAKGGSIANYFPTSIIKGMLAAIGIILILKQIPHILGYDIDYIGDLNFLQWDKKNTFSELYQAISKVTPGAALISILSICIIVFYPILIGEKYRIIPAALIVVAAGIVMNHLFGKHLPNLFLREEHLVNLPQVTSDVVKFLFRFPDWSMWNNQNVIIAGITLAIVASIESLVSIKAVDKLDTLKRTSPPNQELKAQGIGNIISGLLGGLPLTAVIVRGAANVSSGAKSKYSAFLHGVFLLVSLLFLSKIINQIPLACLAAILLTIGYKLTDIKLYKRMYYQGWEHFIPFMATVLGIVFTDLLIGIGIGMATAALFILRRNLLNPFKFEKQDDDSGHRMKLVLSEEVSFLNKANIIQSLERVPKNSQLIIDATNSRYIDDDIIEVFEEFKITAREKNIHLEMLGFGKAYQVYFHHKKENFLQQDYEKLFHNNKKWVEDKTTADPKFFTKHAEGQYPKFLFIGCSDSRLVVNEITGTDPGEIFVHRNIANLVVHTDMNLMSVLHYSVEVLKVQHVIVCGHYGCGGVKAAIDNHDHGLIDKWLTNIKDVYRLYYDELESIKDDELKHKKLVELNVREQVYHLVMTSVVQKAWEMGENLEVHGWVYDMQSGYIKDLNINIQKDLKHFGLYRFEKSFFPLLHTK